MTARRAFLVGMAAATTVIALAAFLLDHDLFLCTIWLCSTLATAGLCRWGVRADRDMRAWDQLARRGPRVLP